MQQCAFFFDQSRCYSCHACSVACKDWNGIEPGPERWMCVYEWETGAFPSVRIHSLAFACGHCDDPACMKACDAGAIYKEELYGAVLVDSEKCVGCRKCYDACPYGAPKFASDNPGEKMTKCTMCIDRLYVGESPVCVSACPLRAFDFGVKDYIVGRYGEERQLEGMPDPSQTSPNFIVKPAAARKQLVDYDEKRALELMQQRGELAPVFENADDVTAYEASDIRRRSLQMKHEDAGSLLAATKNNAG